GLRPRCRRRRDVRPARRRGTRATVRSAAQTRRRPAALILSGSGYSHFRRRRRLPYEGLCPCSPADRGEPVETIENLQSRVDALNLPELTNELDENGCVLTGPLLSDDECAELAALWDDDARFRTTVDMSRYRYGHGIYKYFGPPVP